MACICIRLYKNKMPFQKIFIPNLLNYAFFANTQIYIYVIKSILFESYKDNFDFVGVNTNCSLFKV